MNNSSFTSKRAHMCIVIAIATSLAISWDSSSFSSDCSDRVPKCQREGEGIEASILYCLCVIQFSLSMNITLQIPTVKVCEIELWTTYQNFMTIQWLAKRKSCDKKDFSLSFDIFMEFPTVRMFENNFRPWCSNFTTIQWWMSPRSSFFWDKFGGMC